MIGQHKRALDHCVSFPPAKCLKHHDEIVDDDEASLLAEDEEVVDVDPAKSSSSSSTLQFQLPDLNRRHHHHHPKFFQVRFDDSSTDAYNNTADLSSDPTRDNSSSQEISSLELCFPVQESSISSPAPSRFFQAALEGLLPRIRGVPIGPDYQAEVPHWNPDRTEKELDEETRLWYGDRVWPCSSPCSPESLRSSRDAGRGRSEGCSCEDQGSVECVRRHVDEEREKVAREVGECAYAKLGLDEMGETVARKWTEQEEKTFAELVRLNPASQRRNFWVPLRYAFPSRRRRELVSYYFNVFVLRRRALQNRFDRDNVDSDDDESDLPPPVLDEEEDWEESEYSDDEEVAAAAEVATAVVAVAEEAEEEGEDWDGEEEEEEEDGQGDRGGEEEEEKRVDEGGSGAAGGGGGDEFAKFSSGGGFAREETEKEILRLSKALDHHQHHHGIVGEMELATTNGAMQEFFGREAEGINLGWERSSS